MRTIFVLLALAFLPVLCKADPIGVTDYQMNITATWIATNPLCGTNCTETMNLSYVFELNNGSPCIYEQGCAGWIQTDTLRVSSSGFMGAFAFNSSFAPASGSYEDDGAPSADGLPFFNAQRDEIDLGFMGPGLGSEKNFGPYMFIYACNFSTDCHDAYPGVPPSDILDNRETSTAVKVPAFDSAWELLLGSAIACTFGFFVKHRLDLAPSR
jgi:hypothetical protein